MKVLVATEKLFAKTAMDGIKKEIEGAGFELALLEEYTDKAQLLDAMKGVNAVIIRSDTVDAEVPEAAKELKIVVRASAEYDNVDLNIATAHGVYITSTPGQNSNVVTELVSRLLIYAVHNFCNRTLGTELMRRKLSIHAYGNTEHNVARVAKGFGVELYAYDAFCPKDVIEKGGVRATDSAEEPYKVYNVVSLHTPVTAGIKNSINRGLLKNMPKGAILVNTTHKEVINEDELIQPMEERPDFRHVVDVTPAADTKFTELFVRRYFPTLKKMGTQAAEANINTGTIAAKQIVGFLKGGCEKLRVSKQSPALW